MSLDLPKLGASMLSAGPVLMQFVGTKFSWWLGLTFIVLGPFLIATKTKKS